MSFWSKIKQAFSAEEAVVVKEVSVLEHDVKPLVTETETVVKKDVVDATKAELKAALLTALQDEKTDLKNAQPGLTAEAEAAVEQIIQTAIQVMIKDGMGAL